MNKKQLEQYRKLFEKVANEQRRKAIALGLAYASNVDTGVVAIRLYNVTFEFDGLTAAGVALDILELERQPHV